jgi:predicted RNase H-like HicB family nuclease
MADEPLLPAAPSADKGPAAYAAALTPPATPQATWSAAVPDLPGCTSAGDTARECMANISDAVEAWFVAALREGRPSPAPSALDELAARPAFAGVLWMRIDRRRAEAVEPAQGLAAATPQGITDGPASVLNSLDADNRLR